MRDECLNPYILSLASRSVFIYNCIKLQMVSFNSHNKSACSHIRELKFEEVIKGDKVGEQIHYNRLE